MRVALFFCQLQLDTKSYTNLQVMSFQLHYRCFSHRQKVILISVAHAIYRIIFIIVYVYSESLKECFLSLNKIN